MFPKLRRRLYKHLWLVRPLTYLLAVAVFLSLVILLSPALGRGLKNLARGPAAAVSFLNPSVTSLESFKGRTNFLLLGVAGGDHPGGELTDSIMLISVELLSGDAVLVSLPRDIWVESLQAKLNTAYFYGEGKLDGGGLTLSRAAVAEIVNQPVHYAALLDFSGFEKAIDIVGGISVDVPHGFVDAKYPIPGKENAEPESDRYQTVEFKAGSQVMDGVTALKYIRSRNAAGEEGTDYARSQRQQRVILSFKKKLLSPKVFLSLKKVKGLYQIFSASVKTDIPQKSWSDLAKLALRVDQDSLRTGILNQGSEVEDIPQLLYHPPDSLYGAWVLIPVDNDWTLVHDYIDELFYQNQTP